MSTRQRASNAVIGTLISATMLVLALPASGVAPTAKDKAIDKVLIARAKAKGVKFSERTNTVQGDVNKDGKVEVAALWDSTEKTGGLVQTLGLLTGSGSIWKLRSDLVVGRSCGRHFDAMEILPVPLVILVSGTQPGTGKACDDTSTVVKSAFQVVGTKLIEFEIAGVTGVVEAPATTEPPTTVTSPPATTPTTVAPAAAPAAAQDLSQFGTAGDDVGSAVVVTSDGSVYVVGTTTGSLAGPNAGEGDVFVRKYDAKLSVVWTRQFGSSGNDVGNAIAVAPDGSYYYVAGTSSGELNPADQRQQGGEDLFLAKFDAAGNKLWIDAFGTSGNDAGRGVAIGADGSVYLVGTLGAPLPSEPTWVTLSLAVKYQPDGMVLWDRYLGDVGRTSGEAIAVGADGTIYVSGTNAGGTPLVVRNVTSRWNPDGTPQWIRRWSVSGGTPGGDLGGAGQGIAVAGDGTSFVTGNFTLSEKLRVLVTRKLTADGNTAWTSLLPASSGDSTSTDVVAGTDGAAFVVGSTSSAIASSPQAAKPQGLDVYVSRINPTASQSEAVTVKPEWIRQFGTSGSDQATAMALGPDGRLYIVGSTDGAFAGSNAGGKDAFLTRYNPAA